MNKDEALKLWDELYLSEEKAYDYASHPMKREDYNNENSIYGWTVDVKQPNKTAGKNLINNEIPSSIVTKTIREGKTSFKIGKFLFEVRKSKDVYGEYDIYDITNINNPLNMEPSDENQNYEFNSRRRKIMLGKNFEDVKEIHNDFKQEESPSMETDDKIIDEELKVQRLKEKIENEGYTPTEEEIKKVEDSNKIEDIQIEESVNNLLSENNLLNEESKKEEYLENQNIDEIKNEESIQDESVKTQEKAQEINENITTSIYDSEEEKSTFNLEDLNHTKLSLLKSTQDFLIENKKLKEELSKVDGLYKLRKSYRKLISRYKNRQIDLFNTKNELEGYKEERDNLIKEINKNVDNSKSVNKECFIDKDIIISNNEDDILGYKQERDNLLLEIDRLNKEYKEEVDSLKSEINELKALNITKNKESEEILLTKQSLLKSVQDFLNENKSLKEELNKPIEKEIDYDMITSNNCLKTANEEFVQEIAKLKQQIEQFNKDSEDINSSKELLIKSNKELIKEINSLKMQANDSIKKDDAIDLITRSNKLSEANNSLSIENNQLKDELLVLKNKQLELSKAQLDKEMALEEDNEVLIAENKELERENLKLNNLNEENNKTISGLRDALDVYLKKEDNSNALASDNALKDAKISELTRQLNEELNKPVEKEMIQVLVFDEKALLENLFIKNEGEDSLFDEFKKVFFEKFEDVNDKNVVDILNEHPEFIKKAKIIEKIIAVDNSDLVATNKSLITANKELLETNKKLKEDLSNTDLKVESQADYIITKNSLVKANQELIIENNNLKEQLDENFNAENRKLQLKNDELSNEILSLKKQLSESEESINSTDQVEYEKIINEYNELKASYNKLKEEIAQNRVDEEDLHLSNSNLLQANKEFSNEIAKLKQQLLDVKTIKEVDPDLIASKESLLKANQEFISEIDRLNKQIETINSEKEEVDPKEEKAKEYFKLKFGSNIIETVDFAGNYIKLNDYKDETSPYGWNYILYDEDKEETLDNILVASYKSLKEFNKNEEFNINGNTFLLQHKDDGTCYITSKDYLADPEIFKEAYEVSSDTVNKVIPLLYIFIRLKAIDGEELNVLNSKIFINLIFLACKKVCNDILFDFHQDNDSLFIAFNGSKQNAYSDVLRFATLLNSYRKSFFNMKKLNAVLVLDRVNIPQVYSHHDFNSILQVTNDSDMKAIQFDLKQGQVISSTIHTTLHIGYNIISDNLLDLANKNLYQSSIVSTEFKEFFKNDIENIDDINFVEYRYVLWKD